MKQHGRQMTLFDETCDSDYVKITDGKKYNKESVFLSQEIINRLKDYKLEDYVSDVENNGLEKTWDYICQFVIDYMNEKPKFLDFKNFGELYEIGLATQDKVLKKKSGQYYTPDDVAHVMSCWLRDCEGTAVCDVACGTGKLILTYLDLIGYEKTRELISSGNLYLYDFDNVALKICRTTIALKYGLDIADKINDVFCDFLDESITLPDNCKVISNPPYAQIDEIQRYWDHTDVLLESKEYYSTFMEKIFSQAISTVIITPFSFISGNKFYSLRKQMCNLGTGFVVAFDNVPGNIFCGRKHGIFNTNTANSVRAAITVMKQSSVEHGYRITPLIRFKNEERAELLCTNVLESMLPDKLQIVDSRNKVFEKIEKDLSDVYDCWIRKSEYSVKDFVSKVDNEYLIDMPNTCRYYTTASARKLSRTGSITINVVDKDKFNFLYCIINSSFTYWWWRIFDGGITYPSGLFNKMPLPFNLLNEDDKSFFAEMANKMISEESSFTITKMNAGVPQENIKFPENYRNLINKRILSILGFSYEGSIFDGVHANHFIRGDANE